MATLGKPDQLIVDDTNIATVTYYYNATIASGQANSDAFRMAGDSVIGLITPATFEPTSLTVQVSLNGTDWVTLNGVSFTVTTSRAYEVSAQSIYGWPFVRLVANSNPAADRVVKVLIKRI
jgi:hypothetical protein